MTQQNLSLKKEKISAFQLAMITIAYVASVRVLASMAEYGLSSIFYYLLAAILFLLPSALISAELATAWPERGGIYVWVKKALGAKWGFLAIWLQFLSNVINLPAFLTFLATTAAYIIFPEYANNKYFLILFILIAFWGMTFISFFGMRISGWINTFGSFVGTFIPVAVILSLGVVWMIKGKPIQTDLSFKALFPPVHSMRIVDIVFLAGLLFSFTGMEIPAAHALDVKDTKRSYPRGIFLAAFLIAIVGVCALAIAIVVPHAQLNIISGIMQTFTIIFNSFHMSWAVPVLALFIVVGGILALNSNVIGPSKGLFGAASGGEIPPFLTKVNKHGMPINMFIVQGFVVSVLAGLFLFMPTVSGSYWMIMGMVTSLYMVMYVLLFVSALVLRYKFPDAHRPFKVPGGKTGMWILSLVGLLSAGFGIIISFFPPSQLEVGGLARYEMTLIAGVIIFAGVGLLIYVMRKPHWIKKV